MLKPTYARELVTSGRAAICAFAARVKPPEVAIDIVDEFVWRRKLS